MDHNCCAKKLKTFGLAGAFDVRGKDAKAQQA